MSVEHDVIWLQPWCDKCAASGEDRLWCQDNVWDACDLCERRSVRYVIDKRQKPRSVTVELPEEKKTL